MTDLQAARAPDLSDTSLYFNRELSWMEFNDRVLQLAEDESVPLLERMKFCAIWNSNLDEFFMVRVAGLHDQIDAGIETRDKAGLTPMEQVERLREVFRGQSRRVRLALHRAILPALAEHGIRIARLDELSDAGRAQVAEQFERQIFPVLTPLAVGLGRPFPYISNLSLSLAVEVRDPATGLETFARVKVPTEMLPRFIRVGESDRCYVPLEEVIAAHIARLFPGMEIVDTSLFRVIRDADLEVSDEAGDLLEAVESELRRRRFGEVVALEVAAGMDPKLRDQLVEALEVEPEDVFETEGLLDLDDLMAIYAASAPPELRDPPWTPVVPPPLQSEEGDQPDVMGAMRKGDLLVHHPYESFTASVQRLIEQASADADVLAIKLTVYRTTDDTPLMHALIRASERGKQAVCMVELKARFDEQSNIMWARRLEQAGVHVVYGLPALKTHAKCVLIVRREGDGVRHYVHVGTGNYHPKTARLYTDFGLMTCDDEVGADVADMFNVLTGFARPRRYRKVLVAPAGLRNGIVEQIERTIEAHEAGKRARIRMKMNALVDGACIRALYRASQAGVPVELNVRGICCLRPGVPGVSEHIRVVSIVGRFLEHSRIYSFERGDERLVLIGSADLMPRNLDTRVELVVPLEEEGVRAEVLDTLDRCFADDTNAWELREDGSWERLEPAGDEPRNVQRELMARIGVAGGSEQPT